MCVTLLNQALLNQKIGMLDLGIWFGVALPDSSMIQKLKLMLNNGKKLLKYEIFRTTLNNNKTVIKYNLNHEKEKN